MRFTPAYRADLKANAGPKEKQAIRRALHPQFAVLWKQQPLRMVAAAFLCPGGSDSCNRDPIF